MKTALSLLALFALATVSHAGGTVVVEPIPAKDLTVYTNDTGKKSLVDVAGEQAVRVEVLQKGPDAWSVMALSPKNEKPIAKGAMLVASLRLRSVGGTGLVGVYAESAVKDKKGSRGSTFEPTTEVQTFRRTAIADHDYAAGEFQVSIHLAGKVQTVDLFDVTLEAYPPGTKFNELNLDPLTWKGREPDAPWRKPAAERIEKYRKADVRVTVTDADGQPVEGAEVRVEQVRHAFRFGTFVGQTLLADNADGEKYREIVRERYNFLTLPAYQANWGWLNDERRTDYFEMADWAVANDKPARGHLLVYPGWAASPSEWFDLPKDELRGLLSRHIPRATRMMRERNVTEWDVTNELRFNKEFMEELGGLEVAADWFKAARKELPDGTLYLNETIILPNGGLTDTEQGIYEGHIQTLLDMGAPLGGIGLQGHFNDEFTPPARVIEILDRFAKFDRPICITEFDMANDDKQSQAAFIRDFYTALFSHPSVVGAIQWGFWEDDMWQPQGHHFTKDWQETPVSRAFNDLVFRQFWTDERTKTAGDGTASARAFKGVQKVTVSHDGYTWSRDVTVGDDGAEVTISVP